MKIKQYKHRKTWFDFNDSYLIFNNPILTKTDDRFDYKEKRWIAIGLLNDINVVMVYTKRGKSIRIISVRKANKKEKEIYNERIK